MGFGWVSEQTPALEDAEETQRSGSEASNEGEPGSSRLGVVQVGSGAALLPTAWDRE